MAQVSLSTRISPRVYAALDKEAEREGVSKASIVEQALRDYLGLDDDDEE